MPVDLSREIVARGDLLDAKLAALFERAGIGALPAGEAQILPAAELGRAAPGKPVALKEGLWPGISRGPNVEGRGDEVASASREPWVDANGFWIAWLRALYPSRFPVLGYEADLEDRVAPFDTLELALIDAWVAGGNYLLAPEPRFRAALLSGEPKALAAVESLGRTARWLRENVKLFRQPVFPTITLLVEPTETTAEIANLMCRRSASPALAPAADPPAADPERIRVLVAVDLQPPAAPVRDRILEHAARGASVVVNGDWWRNSKLKPVRSQEDREFFSLGAGQVVAYRDAIADPSEFALDVIDVVTHRRRAARLWNAPAAIVTATGKGLLHCVNYGSPARSEVQARIHGAFTRATLLRPDGPPADLKAARRGSTTEVMIPSLSRLAVVVFG